MLCKCLVDMVPDRDFRFCWSDQPGQSMDFSFQVLIRRSRKRAHESRLSFARTTRVGAR